MKKLLQDAIQKTWTEAKLTLQGIEEEVERRLRQTLDHADWNHQSEEVQRMLMDLGRRLQQSGDVLEKQVQEKMQVMVSKVREPLIAELAFLKTQAEQLSQRIESQLKREKAAKVDPPDVPTDSEP